MTYKVTKKGENKKYTVTAKYGLVDVAGDQSKTAKNGRMMVYWLVGNDQFLEVNFSQADPLDKNKLLQGQNDFLDNLFREFSIAEADWATKVSRFLESFSGDLKLFFTVLPPAP